jgi:hypothetical protein
LDLKWTSEVNWTSTGPQVDLSALLSSWNHTCFARVVDTDFFVLS